MARSFRDCTTPYVAPLHDTGKFIFRPMSASQYSPKMWIKCPNCKAEFGEYLGLASAQKGRGKHLRVTDSGEVRCTTCGVADG